MMKRRTFLQQAAALVAAGGLTRVGWAQDTGLRVVLRGAKAPVDGAWKTPDIGIDRSGKLVVAEAGALQAGEIIPLDGKVVCPGFIDILSDNTADPLRTYSIVERYKVSDGVTTALQMHGGSADAAGYYRAFGQRPHRINYGVSTAVMRVRYAANRLSDRLRLVERCLEEGALGVSHSIEYQPTPYEEVLGYARLAKKYDRPVFLHLRYSSEAQELDGVEESIRLARDSGARVHISHLHSTGGTFHMEEALAKLRRARTEGLEMTCCVYPYSYWATYLHSTRFDEGWQRRYGLTYNDLQLVGTGERLTKATFEKYRAQKRLVAVPEGTMPLEQTVDLALRESFCYIGSDGGIEYASQANSHPRGAGCFSTAVRHGQKIGLPLENILGKMTEGPRHLLRPVLEDRGILRSGAWADLTVFDPLTINGAATVSNPNQYSRGIDRVFVNGQLAYQAGSLNAQAGQPIRR
ncbi:MAG: nitrate reductase [Cyclobacteriaceae bacterium]|nr:nitrate reductase [Cyclobacteriaceae bacterium]